MHAKGIAILLQLFAIFQSNERFPYVDAFVVVIVAVRLNNDVGSHLVSRKSSSHCGILNRVTRLRLSPERYFQRLNILYANGIHNSIAALNI
ncbi:hypothetical protein DERP_006676 [Dermatophagoides pteronyssinus]|uniref:Secreted protein n=1 Tax=Dermatophagoides pteronyssinus TaxID=6956 RepID=A0ABQ8IQX1_DERPT|nr:hypothetical protein DERP_006676 [Dermatophagoides pteronyssinus]